MQPVNKTPAHSGIQKEPQHRVMKSARDDEVADLQSLQWRIVRVDVLASGMSLPYSD
jgi:hypothetical protein